MFGLDYIVAIIVAAAAIGGFLRGFVQETLSLAAWIVAAIAIRYLQVPVSDVLSEYLGNGISTEVIALLLLLIIPYAIIRFIAVKAGRSSRASALGPIDRVLGLGFGALKGFVVVVIGFSMLVMGYDAIWGTQGRPGWIVEARTYSLVDAGSRALISSIGERRDRLNETAPAQDE